MARVADRSLVAVWRDRIERQQRSGLSIQVFCQEEGVAQGTFYAWKRRGKAGGARCKEKRYVCCCSTRVTTRAID